MRKYLSVYRSAAILTVALLLTFGCQNAETPSGPGDDQMKPIATASLQAPGIDIEKATNGFDADVAPGPSIPPGAPVVWTYVVTNTGDEVLTGVTVIDDMEGPILCPLSTLAPGQSMTCSQLAQAVPGQYENLATVVAYSALGDSVADSDPSHYNGGSTPPEEPGLEIEKATNGHDADAPPGPSIKVGDPVEWTYVVTNIGTVPLENVTVTDDQGVAVSCPTFMLLPGESMTCTGHGTAQLGQYANIGTATAEWIPVGAGPILISDDDPSHYVGYADSVLDVLEIDIEKATNGHDADVPPGPTLNVGDPVTWTYVVTNTSTSATLTNVTVTDDQGVVVVCPKTTLAAGESMICTGNGTAQLGQYANMGTVSAEWVTPGAGPIVLTDEDPSHYFGEMGEETGDEGCSPGFWKNHMDMWAPAGASGAMGLASVFSSAAAFTALQNSTLMDALNFKGGKGVDGAARILLRQAVAAWLNAKHPDIAYPRLSSEIVVDVNSALAGGDRNEMLEMAEELDHDNNMGCSL